MRSKNLLLLAVAGVALGCGSLLGIEELPNNAGAAGSSTAGTGTAGDAGGGGSTAGDGGAAGDAGGSGDAGAGGAGAAGDGGAAGSSAGAGGDAGAGGACIEGTSTCTNATTALECAGGVLTPKPCAAMDCKKIECVAATGMCQPNGDQPDGSPCSNGSCKAGACSACICPDGNPMQSGQACGWGPGTSTGAATANLINGTMMQTASAAPTLSFDVTPVAPFTAKALEFVWGGPGSITCSFTVKSGGITLGTANVQSVAMPNITQVGLGPPQAVATYHIDISCSGGPMAAIDEVVAVPACAP